jgi:hypothetical protein
MPKGPYLLLVGAPGSTLFGLRLLSQLGEIASL